MTALNLGEQALTTTLASRAERMRVLRKLLGAKHQPSAVPAPSSGSTYANESHSTGEYSTRVQCHDESDCPVSMHVDGTQQSPTGQQQAMPRPLWKNHKPHSPQTDEQDRTLLFSSPNEDPDAEDILSGKVLIGSRTSDVQTMRPPCGINPESDVGRDAYSLLAYSGGAALLSSAMEEEKKMLLKSSEKDTKPTKYLQGAYLGISTNSF